MRKLLALLGILMIGICLVTAQTTKITGVVVSAEDGEPIIGASIIVNGTTQGTVTDISGNFNLNVSSKGKTITVSYVGMQPQTLSIKPKMRIVLQAQSKDLEEVVVTALGMKRSEKALGYASTTVKDKELTAGRSGSVMTGLTGKVAGVNISSAGTTGTAQKVIVRGFSSFTNNQPLYVVDGIPLQNSFSGLGNAGEFSNNVDFGNSANDINPEDVESVTVLKGASATALYGSRAANGVIMITTKRGEIGRPVLTYDGTFTASNVLRVPQTQDRFGQGWPWWDSMENGSWGPALDGRTHVWGSNMLLDGSPQQEKPFSFVKNNTRNFYQTGFETNNNVSLRMGNNNLGMMLSYGNVSTNGILPNDADTYDRNTFSLRTNAQYNKFTMDASLNYVRKDISRVATGQGDNGATTFQELIQNVVDVNISGMKDYNNIYNNLDNYYTVYAENPYWVLDHNKNKYQDDRTYGKMELSYEFIKGLTATGRLGGDVVNSRQKMWSEKVTYTPGSYSEAGGKNTVPGSYVERNEHSTLIDATAFVNANHKLTDKIGLDATMGWNLNQVKTSYIESSIYELSVPGYFSLANTGDKPNSESYYDKKRLIGLFAQAELSYDNFLFVNLSARNDWSSTLPKDDNSFFYGGINASLILSELIHMNPEYISFLKLRAAWGQTGNDAPIYRTSAYFVPALYGIGFGDLNLPLNNQLGLTLTTRMPSKTLKPEITREGELGITAHFLNNRITLDAAYYDRLTKDQIISAAVAPEIGYRTSTRNVGKISNRGIELAATFTPIRNRDWLWQIGTTFSKNKSKVKELWDGNQQYVLDSNYQVQFVAKVGEPLGVFTVPAVNRVKEGEHAGKVIVNSLGFPTTSSTERDVIGTSNPDFVMGFNTTLKWKNLSMNAVIDWRKGGYFYSYTAQLMHFNGNATPTVYNNRDAFVVPNSVRLINGQYVENSVAVDKYIQAVYYYNNGYNYDQFHNFVLPKDYVKLRELSVTYEFPKKWLAKTPVSQLQVSFIGRNLFMRTAKKNNYVDPEGSNYGNDIYSEIGEFAAAPTTRNIGGGIKVVF